MALLTPNSLGTPRNRAIFEEKQWNYRLAKQAWRYAVSPQHFHFQLLVLDWRSVKRCQKVSCGLIICVPPAGIVAGLGSASFEIIRDLVEKLPAMITPRWLNTLCQPIGVRNVIQYLSRAWSKWKTPGMWNLISAARKS
jgi:hypothetical protein